MKARATAHNVALLAKVSQSAVSRTFTPGASVAPETRQRVMEAAKALGYRPNAIARTLITRRSRMVALLMSYLENQFYPLVIELLSQTLQKHGYHVLLFIGDNSEDVLTELMQYQVEGIVMASTMMSSGLAKDCAEAGIPVVLFNRVSNSHGFLANEVTSDNYVGGRLAASTLLNAGYKRLAFVAGAQDASTNAERERGFLDVLEESGVRLHAREVGHYDFLMAQQATRSLFSKETWPDAIFFANDHMAIAGLDVIRQELGLTVPDIGVIGFDDVPQASWAAYRLTTIKQDLSAMVEATVELLVKGATSQSRRITLPCSLVERATVRSSQPR